MNLLVSVFLILMPIILIVRKESSYLYLMPLLFSFHAETKNLGKKIGNIKRTILLKSILILKRPLCYPNDIV